MKHIISNRNMGTLVTIVLGNFDDNISVPYGAPVVTYKLVAPSIITEDVLVQRILAEIYQGYPEGDEIEIHDVYLSFAAKAKIKALIYAGNKVTYYRMGIDQNWKFDLYYSILGLLRKTKEQILTSKLVLTLKSKIKELLRR